MIHWIRHRQEKQEEDEKSAENTTDFRVEEKLKENDILIIPIMIRENDILIILISEAYNKCAVHLAIHGKAQIFNQKYTFPVLNKLAEDYFCDGAKEKSQESIVLDFWTDKTKQYKSMLIILVVYVVFNLIARNVLKNKIWIRFWIFFINAPKSGYFFSFL